MTIKLFRLITGEDLISDVKENLSESPDFITLDNPAVISIVPNREGTGASVGIAPYMPMIDGDVTLSRAAIISQGQPDEKLEDEYRQRFGSGIVVPPKKLII
jgi:hypothetical protein